VLLLSLFLAIYPAAAAGIAWRYGRSDRLRLALWFAAAWIVTEWLRATLFTGFAWNPLGVVLVPTPVSRIAAGIGTYGLSGVAALLAGTLLLLLARRWRSAGAIAGAIAAATLLALILNAPPEGSTRMAMRIVQPNIGQEDKWRPGFEREIFARLAGLSKAGSNEPRLLMWPEAAVTTPLEDGSARTPRSSSNRPAARRPA